MGEGELHRWTQGFKKDIYIYIYICVCVCVFLLYVSKEIGLKHDEMQYCGYVNMATAVIAFFFFFSFH
jgi:hypothetical protein